MFSDSTRILARWLATANLQSTYLQNNSVLPLDSFGYPWFEFKLLAR